MHSVQHVLFTATTHHILLGHLVLEQQFTPIYSTLPCSTLIYTIAYTFKSTLTYSTDTHWMRTHVHQY